MRSSSAAGASAGRAFREARAAWRKQIGWRIAAIVVAVGLLAIPVRLFWPAGSFVSGVWVGGALAIALWVWDQPPNFVERWRQGRDGERQTGKELRKLGRREWSIRHDARDRFGNLDHIVVGPGGVFLLDSKNLWGTFRVEDGVLSCHHDLSPLSDYALPKLPTRMAAMARSLERQLHQEVGWIVDVRPVVVLWAAFPELEAHLHGVAIVRGDRLVDWLKAQPTRVCQRDRELIFAAVAALPAA